MYGRDFWKRTTFFVLAFGFGVLVAENSFLSQEVWRPAEQLLTRQGNIYTHQAFGPDCVREYVVIPLARDTFQSEVMYARPTNSEKRESGLDLEEIPSDAHALGKRD